MVRIGLTVCLLCTFIGEFAEHIVEYVRIIELIRLYF